MFDDAFFKERLPLGSHDKIMRVVLVVDNILQVNVGLVFQIEEKLLIEYEGDAAALLDLGLLRRPVVDKVGRDADGEAAAKLLPIEAGQCVAASVRAYYDIERFVRQVVALGQDSDAPPRVGQLGAQRLDDFFEGRVEVDLDSKQQRRLQQDTLQFSYTFNRKLSFVKHFTFKLFT